jgi:hypothetical protein
LIGEKRTGKSACGAKSEEPVFQPVGIDSAELLKKERYEKEEAGHQAQPLGIKRVMFA